MRLTYLEGQGGDGSLDERASCGTGRVQKTLELDMSYEGERIGKILWAI